MVYNMPFMWWSEKIMNKLTLWGKTLSISIKTWKKYHLFQVIIKLNSFKTATFDQKDWTTDLSDILVWWFPASWMLKEKENKNVFRLQSWIFQNLWPLNFFSEMESLLNFWPRCKVKLSTSCLLWKLAVSSYSPQFTIIFGLKMLAIIDLPML
jgi:hypothetical protein